MARDYNKKRAAAPEKKKGGKSPAGWLWMLTGLVVGLFIAFLVFLSERGKAPEEIAKAPIATPEQKKPAKAPEAAAADTGTGKETAPAPEKKPLEYDFYNILPKFEVKVPKEQGTASAPPPPKAGTAVDGFVLQVGSFRSAKDAEARKAELALLGIVSSVQAVTVDGDVTYHRVRVGPLHDAARFNNVRQTLRENGIEFMTLRERS